MSSVLFSDHSPDSGVVEEADKVLESNKLTVEESVVRIKILECNDDTVHRIVVEKHKTDECRKHEHHKVLSVIQLLEKL